MNELEKYLAEVREREQAATKGPWERTDVEILIDGDGMDASTLEPNLVLQRNPDGTVLRDTWELNGEDIDFIAHARSDVPKLLRIIERLQSEIDYLCPQFGHTYTEDDPPCKCRVCSEREQRDGRLDKDCRVRAGRVT